MDLLYARYSDPLNLMNMYINRGRFGNFVDGFLQAEFERRKEEAEKYNDMMKWIYYIHSYTSESYKDWESRVYGKDSTTKKKSSDAELDDKGISNLLTDLF